jgi:hypothetical protein
MQLVETNVAKKVSDSYPQSQLSYQLDFHSATQNYTPEIFIAIAVRTEIQYFSGDNFSRYSGVINEFVD